MIFRLLALFALLLPSASLAQGRAEIERTMRRATQYMVERVADHGGYVWTYLPDLSRRWGEMEAEPGMLWVQAPGTATMGHLFLDAFNATGDAYYYDAAARAADALVAGQHRSGGWNYFIHRGGPVAARRWYATIGRNGWRLEEFQHYSDNATFDDAGTAETMQLLLRLYMVRHEPRFRPPLDRAIAFVLRSQYPNGGWPQRWPYGPQYPAYQRLITFNDDVAKENIRFLIMAGQALERPALLRAARRGMEIFLATQGRAPQAGWGLQYDMRLNVAGARTYEPRALVTHTTAANVEQLMEFYRLTGERRFLEHVPDALAWLASVRLPDGVGPADRRFPTFVQLGTNRPLYNHRRGSNVVNGRYWQDHDPARPIAHYSQFRGIDLDRLRREHDRLAAMPVAEATRGSPLLERRPFPRFFILDGLAAGSDFSGAARLDPRAIVRDLNEEGWWPAPLTMTSHPYRGPGRRRIAPGDFATTQVGDETDTSPFPDPSPATGISTATYIANMARLIGALQGRR
ncbi:MAG TPA: pectate lyase [Allosphingosinicella sp.]|nr:pectate lyase [Allosphingosinicella sp.]